VIAALAGSHWYTRNQLVSARADSKPEALTVLETTDDHYKVLIMSDGVSNGAPAVYEVPR
jgi:hypothetical protein